MPFAMTRRTSRGSGSPAAAPDTGAPTLPAWKAFVVQFSRGTATRTGVFAGRVEHLNSGRRARFESRQDLLATLERLLDEIEEPSR